MSGSEDGLDRSEMADPKVGFDDDEHDDGGDQGFISCGILLSGTGARGVSSEHMENIEMFSCSPT